MPSVLPSLSARDIYLCNSSSSFCFSIRSFRIHLVDLPSVPVMHDYQIIDSQIADTFVANLRAMTIFLFDRDPMGHSKPGIFRINFFVIWYSLREVLILAVHEKKNEASFRFTSCIKTHKEYVPGSHIELIYQIKAAVDSKSPFAAVNFNPRLSLDDHDVLALPRKLVEVFWNFTKEPPGKSDAPLECTQKIPTGQVNVPDFLKSAVADETLKSRGPGLCVAPRAHAECENWKCDSCAYRKDHLLY